MSKVTNKIFRYIWFLAIMVFIGCNGNSSQKGEKSITNNSKELSAETIYNDNIDKVAMIISYKDGIPLSQGSGFFIDKNTLVTNYHCVNGAETIEFKISGNETVFKDGRVIKASDKYDLAIIKTKQDFPFVEIDSSNKDKVGSKVYAIGNPRGLEGTISDGILSGKRNNDGIEYLQITAPINPGNSGGPVLNERGDVIGVATFTYKNSQNLNFAMPICYIDKCFDIDSLQNKAPIVKTDTAAVTVVSYSKGSDENYQQVSFHNNTTESITSISGVLVYRRKMVEYKGNGSSIDHPYKDWKYWLGDIFHYQVFSVNVDIAPKMSKLVTIPCDNELYEHRYCDSQLGCTDCGKTNLIHFDYEFRLLSYEIEE